MTTQTKDNRLRWQPLRFVTNKSTRPPRNGKERIAVMLVGKYIDQIMGVSDE